MKSCFLSGTSFIPDSIPYPCFLNDFQLTSSAKLLYCFLLGSTLTSGEEDKNGHLYVCQPIESLSDDFFRSTSTLKRLLRELEDARLLKRTRQKIGTPSRIYPLFPEYVCKKAPVQEISSTIQYMRLHRLEGHPFTPSLQEFSAAQAL